MIRLATGILAALVLIVAPASAELVHSNITGSASGPVNAANAPVSITQNLDPNTVVAGSVHCGTTGTPYHTPNSYMRRFLLSAQHGINATLTVNSVDIAHESANTDSGEPQPIDVNLYTIGTGVGTLTFGALASIGSATIMVPTGTALALENVAVNGVVGDPTLDDLVVEIFSPDGRDPVFNSYYVGSNNLGQIQPAYLAAVDCGIPEPTATSAIGFPDMHVIMVVNGDTEGGTPTEDASWSSIKALYQ